MEKSRKGIDLQTLRSQLRPESDMSHLSDAQIREQLEDTDKEIQSGKLANWREAVDSFVSSGQEIPSAEHVFQDVHSNLSSSGTAESGLAHTLLYNKELYLDYIEGLGYPREATKAAGESEKDTIRSHIESEMDISQILDDPSVDLDDFGSFSGAVKRYLESKGVLHGDWVKAFEAQFASDRAMQVVSEGLASEKFFKGFESVLQAKQKEAQEIKREEERIKILIEKPDGFLADDYLRNHKSLDKKLAEGSLKSDNVMKWFLKDQKVSDEAFKYLQGQLPKEFENFTNDLQKGYKERLEKRREDFDKLFDKEFSGAEWGVTNSGKPYDDATEQADLKEMIYTSAKEATSLNDLNAWYRDDQDRFKKYRKCLDDRIAIEKEMLGTGPDSLSMIGDPQLESEYTQLVNDYKSQRKRWSGGAYYSPGDQWVYVKNFYDSKVKGRSRQLQAENQSERSGLIAKMEGGAFDWGDNEKLGKRMGKYVDGILNAEPPKNYTEKQALLRSLSAKFPTLQSQLGEMYKLWDGMEKEIGKDTLKGDEYKKMLEQRDGIWKSMLGQIMPRGQTEFQPEKWSISQQASQMRKLVGDMRKAHKEQAGEGDIKKEIEAKIKQGDLKGLTFDEHDLAKGDNFEKELLKSWGYTKSQFTSALGGDQAKGAISKMRKQWLKEYNDHWKSVVDEGQVKPINQKLDALPAQWSAVGAYFLQGMKKHAGPRVAGTEEASWKPRHEWLLQNSAKIDETIRAMNSHIQYYDGIMNQEGRKDFIYKDQPQWGQKFNKNWKTLTDKIATGNFSNLGAGLGGYDSETRKLLVESEKAYELYQQEKEQEKLQEQEKLEQEEADKQMEAEFKAGSEQMDRRFNMFMRRQQAIKPGATTAAIAGGATGGGQNPFRNESELRDAVLKGMNGMTDFEEKAFFDKWIKEKFKALEEGTLDDEESPLDGLGILNKRLDDKRKEFEDRGFVVENQRHLELLDRYNIRPDYLGRTGLSLDKLTRGLERMDRLGAESGKVGYISQMMRENSLNSTGVFGTMVIGMLSVMEQNDFDAWKSDLRKMDFKMGKPDKQDAVLLMNSLFTNDRLMSQVNKDLSDLRSKFVSEGLKLINVDLKDILEDKEAVALEEIMKEIEEAEEKEREANTPEGEVKGYFELNGIEVDEAVMKQLSEYGYDPKVSASGLSKLHLQKGLERIQMLNDPEFRSLDKVLREGTRNGYLPNHLFESLSIISDAEFADWERQVRGMNLSGLNEEEKAYEMMKVLFDQGTLERLGMLEDDGIEGVRDEGIEGAEDSESETGEIEEGVGVFSEKGVEEGTEGIGDGGMEGSEFAESLSEDDTEVGVGHEFVLDGEEEVSESEVGEMEDGVLMSSEDGDEAEGELEDGEIETGEEQVDDGEAELTDAQIDAIADAGDDRLIDAEADKGDALLEEEAEQLERVESVDDGDEEVSELASEQAGELMEEEVELREMATVEAGVDVGAQTVAEGTEVDGASISGQAGELANEQPTYAEASVDAGVDEDFDMALLEERPYATAEDFADGDDEDSELASERDGELGDEVLEGELPSDEEIDAQADEGDELLEEEAELTRENLTDQMREMTMEEFEEALLDLELDAEDESALRKQKAEMDAVKEQEEQDEREKLEGEEKDALYSELEGNLGEMTTEELEDALKDSDLDDKAQKALLEQKSELDAERERKELEEQEELENKELDDVYAKLESQLGEIPADEFEATLQESGLDDTAQKALREQRAEMDAEKGKEEEREKEKEEMKERDELYQSLESQIGALPADEFEQALKDSDLDEKSQEALWSAKTEFDAVQEQEKLEEQEKQENQEQVEFRENLESQLDDITVEDLDTALKDGPLDKKAQEEIREMHNQRASEQELQQKEAEGKALDEARTTFESQMDEMDDDAFEDALKSSEFDEEVQEELREQRTESLRDSELASEQVDDGQKVEAVDENAEIEQALREEILDAEKPEAEIAKLEDDELKAELQQELNEQTDKQGEADLEAQLTLKEQTELVGEIQSWATNEGWQLGVGALMESSRKAKEQLLKDEVLTEKQQENLETAFDQAREELDKREELDEQDKLEEQEALENQEEEQLLAEEQETEKQAEVERMLSDFVELMVGEKEKAEMDRQKEESEKEERKQEVLDLIKDSAKTEKEAGGGLDLDGVLDIFKEDIADFGQNRLVRKIYHSKDVMRKARGMMEYFLTQDMYKQLLKLNMRSTSMLSEDGWHFFAELYGESYVTQVMTLREIVQRFYHYVSVLEDGEVDLEIKLSKGLLQANITNADSVYRQLVGMYHMQKKQDDLTKVVIGGNKKYLDIAMLFGKRTELGDAMLEIESS